ncbi:hypothetical protein BMNI_I0711 [Brucella melitensis NI]|nr:hypothetical protein BMNI_I0711 [Brucella melitensis NI]
MALGAILALGAFSLWSTAQHKSPQAALSALFQRPAPKPAPAATAKAENKPAPGKTADTKAPARDSAAAVGPVPRPAAPVAPTPQKPVQTAAVAAPKPPRPSGSVVASVTPAAPHAMPPRGVNTPANSPSVIYAKAKLTIHKNAWDRSPAIATIEKGREMRSYGKTGRWHRVVVPSTNIIGWVHEDQLIGGHNKPDSATLITGSVAKKAPSPASTPAHVQSHILPPKAVGAKN